MSKGSTRRSFEIEGLRLHGDQPIPAASRVRNIVVTGAIGGYDPASGKVPDDEKAQIALAFGNLARVLSAAGATLEDVIEVSISVKSMALKDAVNEFWIAAFPNPHSRPARHLTEYSHYRSNVAIALEAFAVIP